MGLFYGTGGTGEIASAVDTSQVSMGAGVSLLCEYRV